MTDDTPEVCAMSPRADAERHLSFEALRAALRALPRPDGHAGEVVLVVSRPSTDGRCTPGRCRLSPKGGVEGDRWVLRENPVLAAQVSVIRADVARVFANGQSLTLSGDNLVVNLDLSQENLPPGARVLVGTALCEVTDKPHRGCDKFAARFGQAARDLTAADDFASWRLRGIYLRVIEAGEVEPGDTVRVVSRPAR